MLLLYCYGKFSLLCCTTTNVSLTRARQPERIITNRRANVMLLTSFYELSSLRRLHTQVLSLRIQRADVKQRFVYFYSDSLGSFRYTREL